MQPLKQMVQQLIQLAQRFPQTRKFVLAVLLFGLLTLIRKRWIQYRRARNQAPPGPIGIPIFGDLLRFWKFHNTRRHFEYLRQIHKQYPSLCSINVGAHDVIIINDLSLLKQVMSRDEMLDRDPAFIDFVGKNSKTHATQNGHEWLTNKKITQDIINTYGIQNIDSVFDRCLKNVILPRIEKDCVLNGKSIKMHKFLRYSFFWTFFRLIYGKYENFKDIDQKYYDDNLEKHVKIRVVPLAFLSHVVGSWYEKIKDFNYKFIFYYFDNYQSIIEKYWKLYNKDSKSKDCMLDLYQKKTDMIDQHQIMNEIGNVMGGAIDNATNVSQYAFYNLGRLQRLQNELYDEIKSVMGNDGFKYSKAGQCIKLKAFIHENMRLLIPNPVGATRYCTKDFYVKTGDNGKTYKICKGTVVWWNIVATTYDNRYWDGDKYDTKNFDINRWLTPDKKKFVNRLELMTFGWGKRKCTGRLIVIKEFLHFFGTLLYNYKIELATNKYNNHIDDVKKGVGFTECQDFPVIFRKRN